MKPHHKAQPLLYLLLFLGMIALSAATFYISSTPVLWTLIFISIPCFVLIFSPFGRKKRALWVNLAAGLLILAIFEGVFIFLEKAEGKHKITEELEGVYESEHDPVLGWRLIRDTSRISKKRINGELVYEARISVNHNGLRITPPGGTPDGPAVLFFGDSFTYGEGVDDSLTLPWQFSSFTNRRFHVYNFGVFGYGPQHMLAMLEHKYPEPIVKERVTHVVYQLLYPEHLYRVLGDRSWDVSGPRYVLNERGQAVFSGNFFTSNRWKHKMQEGIPGRSAILRKIFNHSWPLKKDDKALFVAIMKQSKQAIEEQYPGAAFHIILWDWSNGEDQWVFDELISSGMHLHHVAEIYPGGISDMACKLHRYDKHPNGEGNRLLAKFLAQHLTDSIPQ